MTVDSSFEKQVVKKVTWRLIPFLFLLFVVAFLDRVNVSFAALSMNADLGFSDAVFGTGAGIFFLGYFLMEVPGNIIMSKTGARVWMTRILVTWGLISACMVFVSTPTQYYTVRFLLGVAEASFTPGIIYYLGNWFRGKDLAKALALFLMAMPASSIFGSPLSSHLMGITWLGWAGWKWMFILEAIPAVVLGVVTFFYLTDHPHQAKWLSEKQRDWLTDIMKKEQAAKTNKKHMRIIDAFRNRDVLLLSGAYLTWITGFYGVTMFLPTIIKAIQQTSDNILVGYVTMVPYIIGLLSMVWVARHSDKTNERRFHTVGCMIAGAIGLSGGVLFSGHSHFLSILFVCIAVGGVYGAFGSFWAIPSSFLTGSTAAAAIAMINSIGNLGGFFGPSLMGFFKSVTGSFNSGLYILSGSLIVCCALLLLLRQSGAAVGEASLAAAEPQTVSE